MSAIKRFSSRRQRLDREFLAVRLAGALSYRRIAGYFRSSIFELVGEEVAGIPDVRIVCNSELDATDIGISKAVREAKLKEVWNELPAATEALLHRDRYRRLYELLTKGNVQIRVVPKEKVFLHGKAGVIELADGSRTAFLGSINESRSAFAENYEVLWEDPSEEAVAWVDEEFEALWEHGYPLPDAIVEEVGRIARRVEVRFEDVAPAQLPEASLAEAPIYRGGEQLQPWQRAFVVDFLRHREAYGKARLLLADEVGLGKTLSLATSAMLSALLDDGRVLVLCPSTLTLQWQVELKDRLGIPSAVWISNRKHWLDQNGHVIRTRGAEDVTRCPSAIAIVSTGLIFHHSDERRHLLDMKFGTVVLDEGHKARRGKLMSGERGEANNLLEFMLKVGPRTKNLLIGTATPIQTDVEELWDLLRVLNGGADFVLGREMTSRWAHASLALPLVKGTQGPADLREAWDLVRNPLAAADDDALLAALRQDLAAQEQAFYSGTIFGDLPYPAQRALEDMASAAYFREHNPVLRHTVLRRRAVLEQRGLLESVAVDVHPDPKLPSGAYPGLALDGLGLLTNHPFDRAYAAAEAFTRELRKRSRAAGFMKNLLLQRICSSFAAGRETARRMLEAREVLTVGSDAPARAAAATALLEDTDDEELADADLSVLTAEEAAHLDTIVAELSREEARDPKLGAVKYFLSDHRTDGRTWLEHGCIIFSQYYDTAHWVATELARAFPDEPVAVYAGAGKSALIRDGVMSAVEREDIKTAVRKRELRLLVATDAACEGLNLQTLGTLINIDLPWNPSRLEQRLGRIKRFGQARKTVDMLNLVYHGTRDERVYATISKRLKDKHDLFGGLPDTIDDDWIDDAGLLEEQLDKYVHLRQAATNVFEARYQSDAAIDPARDRWDLCAQVLSRKDVVEKLSQGW